jgi:hypothetical protein
LKNADWLVESCCPAIERPPWTLAHMKLSLHFWVR